MNAVRTTMLLAAMTALFMALGHTISGAAGAGITLAVAAGMNLATFRNPDRVLAKIAPGAERTRAARIASVPTTMRRRRGGALDPFGSRD